MLFASTGLIIHGDKMRVHAIQESQEEERKFRDYAGWPGGNGSPAEELKQFQ